MSFRASLKVPKYGLFYFPIDQTTSIIPIKNIQKVVQGDNVSKGSKVMVKFERQVYQAEIIGVNDDFSELRETESKFLEDPGNSELFKKQEEATSAITSEEPTEIADKTIEKAASKKRKQSVADEKAKVKKEKGSDPEQATIPRTPSPAPLSYTPMLPLVLSPLPPTRKLRPSHSVPPNLSMQSQTDSHSEIITWLRHISAQQEAMKEGLNTLIGVLAGKTESATPPAENFEAKVQQEVPPFIPSVNELMNTMLPEEETREDPYLYGFLSGTG